MSSESDATRVPTMWLPVGTGVAALLCKARDFRMTTDTAAPVVYPVRLSCCGLSLLLSAMKMMAVAEVRDEQRNLTEISHDWPTPKGDTQVLVCENAFGSAPPIVIPEMVNGAVPVFVSVAV